MRSEAVTVSGLTTLTCGNVLSQRLCWVVRSVRIEGSGLQIPSALPGLSQLRGSKPDNQVAADHSPDLRQLHMSVVGVVSVSLGANCFIYYGPLAMAPAAPTPAMRPNTSRRSD